MSNRFWQRECGANMFAEQVLWYHTYVTTTTRTSSWPPTKRSEAVDWTRIGIPWAAGCSEQFLLKPIWSMHQVRNKDMYFCACARISAHAAVSGVQSNIEHNMFINAFWSKFLNHTFPKLRHSMFRNRFLSSRPEPEWHSWQEARSFTSDLKMMMTAIIIVIMAAMTMIMMGAFCPFAYMQLCRQSRQVWQLFSLHEDCVFTIFVWYALAVRWHNIKEQCTDPLSCMQKFEFVGRQMLARIPFHIFKSFTSTDGSCAIKMCRLSTIIIMFIYLYYHSYHYYHDHYYKSLSLSLFSYIPSLLIFLFALIQYHYYSYHYCIISYSCYHFYHHFCYHYYYHHHSYYH